MHKEYRQPLDINAEEWLELLENGQIFRDLDLRMIKTLYESENRLSGGEIAEVLGMTSHNPFNGAVKLLGKRIMNYFPDIAYPSSEDGKLEYWHIPFLGEASTNNKRFYWHLRPELGQAITVYFFKEEGQKSLPKHVPEIRLLPMSKEDPEFHDKNVAEIQNWFKFDLPYRKYNFKSGMEAPLGTLILFQFQNKIIASAILENKEVFEETNEWGYKGCYRFIPSSIGIFDPLSVEDVCSVWNDFPGFSQVKRKLDNTRYAAFKKLLKKKSFRLVQHLDEGSFQEDVECLTATSELEMDKPRPIGNNERITSRVARWARDARVSRAALELAQFSCELDSNHESFTSKNTQKRYVEAHHLVPMEYQAEFRNSLDVSGNIVMLCPNCHRKIHYGVGEEKWEMLDYLLKQRATRLKKSGLDIDEGMLKKMYGSRDS